MFLDPIGPDEVPATGDEDVRLLPDSPCINRGDPGFENYPGGTDFYGNLRLQGCRVEIGAHGSNVAEQRGDFDGNGRFDLADFAGFQSCFGVDDASPGLRDACVCVFDFDGGYSLDLGDFAAFQLLLAGP